jgi:phage shock protein A
MSAESTVKAQEPGLAAQNEVVDQLKRGLDEMKGQLGELTASTTRSSTAVPQRAVPGPAIGRYEVNIRRQEATVRGHRNCRLIPGPLRLPG